MASVWLWDLFICAAAGPNVSFAPGSEARCAAQYDRLRRGALSERHAHLSIELRAVNNRYLKVFAARLIPIPA